MNDRAFHEILLIFSFLNIPPATKTCLRVVPVSDMVPFPYNTGAFPQCLGGVTTSLFLAHSQATASQNLHFFGLRTVSPVL